MSADELQAWEQMPDETESAFELFAMYRDLGRGRTYFAAYNLWLEKRGKKKVTRTNAVSSLYGVYSRKYNWDERCLAYDRFIDRHVVEQRIADVRSMTKRHAQLAMNMQGLVAKRMQDMIEKDAWSELGVKDIPRWLEIAVKIERLSRGEATEQVASSSATPVSQLDLSKLSDDDFAALRQISERAAESRGDSVGGSPPKEDETTRLGPRLVPGIQGRLGT